jgi:hypothetical protein
MLPVRKSARRPLSRREHPHRRDRFFATFRQSLSRESAWRDFRGQWFRKAVGLHAGRGNGRHRNAHPADLHHKRAGRGGHADQLHVGTAGNEEVLSVNPVVGETNDGYLSDIRGRHITPEEGFAAVKNAKGGAVEEGDVSAGTGTNVFQVLAGLRNSWFAPKVRKEHL